jgi:hypothetical protein
MKSKQALIPGIFLMLMILYHGTNWISSPRITWQASPLQVSSQDSSTIKSLSDKFPPTVQTWRELIGRNAEKYQLDPDLIASVILQESGGDPSAYSSSGAVGLMQVMPRDGIAANFICGDYPCFESRPEIKELKNPEFNIDYGSHLLKDLLDKYGDWREALRAYGPMDMGYQYADIVLSIYSNSQ